MQKIPLDLRAKALIADHIREAEAAQARLNLVLATFLIARGLDPEQAKVDLSTLNEGFLTLGDQDG